MPVGRLSSRVLSTLALLALLVAPAAAQQARVEVEESDGKSRIWVAQQLVRETTASVTVGPNGGDPSGRGLFVTWNEAGERYSSFSRNGGVHWSPGRLVRTELRLRDGAIRPGGAMPAAPSEFHAPAGTQLHIVQFYSHGLPEWRTAIAATGAELLNHLPHNAHIVRGTAETIALVKELGFVERVENYRPWYRLGPNLRAWLLDATGDPAETVRVRAMTPEWGPEGKSRVVASAEALGAAVAEYWPSGHVVELWVNRSQLQSLSGNDDVLWIDLWTPRSTDMDLVREDAGTDWIEDNFGYCGQGVRGEVMDSGVQTDHPDFDGILHHGGFDQSSHGTSTYGIVFGNGDRDGDGNAQGTGHMPCAEQGIFADYGFLGDRFAHTQALTQSPYFASFQTNSWGASQTTVYTSVSQEMDDIIWRLDFAILNSQSNTGNQTSRPQAWAKNIISVGGIRHFNTLDPSDDSWTGGASIGPAEDGRIKPDINYWYDSIYTTTTGSGYTTGFGGTSGATPEAAGVLGLMVQMWADNVWDTNPQGATVFEKQPHASTIKALMINNAQQYAFTGPTDDLTRVHQGWGRPSSRLAHERAATSFIVDEEEPLELGESVTYTIDVQPAETELKITMIYPDPPGTTSSSLHRINNVNLKVTSPSAVVYHGNVGLSDGTASLPGGAPDDLNTVENVFVPAPESGLWEIEIEATEVNQDGYLNTAEDDVVFALVTTGGSGIYTSGQGRVSFNRNVGNCDQSFELLVRDGNVGSSSLSVTVWSDTETAPETLTLNETSPGSGRYTGPFSTVAGAPVAADGLISVTHADTIYAEYIDADDGGGQTLVAVQDTADADCVGPQISQVSENSVSDDTATIVWTTDEKADSVVTWGDVAPPTQMATSPLQLTSHAVGLSGLQPCTSYYYSVGGEDIVGNSSSDDNGGNFFRFETLGDLGTGTLQSCRAGRMSIDVERTGCVAGSVPLSLSDLDLNLDPGMVETVSVLVTSSTETTPEVVLLTETTANSSIFAGSLPTAVGAAIADGTLQVGGGDLLTARYNDADDGTGSANISVDTIPVDCTPPAITFVGVSGITDVAATVSFDTSVPTTGTVEWGTTPALGNVAMSTTLQDQHSVALGPLAECSSFYFRVNADDGIGNTAVADVAGSPFRFDANTVGGTIFRDDFETTQGWTLAGDWEIGVPQGLGSPGDPLASSSGTQVLGQDLSGQGANPGDYEPSTQFAATSPVIDASSLSNAQLRFDRWLNTSSLTNAFVEANDGSGWFTVYSSGFAAVGGSSWTSLSYDVSTWADGNPNFQIRFRQLASASATPASGWNVDRLLLRDSTASEYGVCGNCGGAPTFAGASAAVDDDACAASGVTVSWSSAPAWGTGSSGTFTIYRDSAPGFTPGPGNLIATGIPGNGWTDALAPDDAISYYLVRAENDETCSTGTANGGVVDANLVYVSASDSTSQPLPDPVGNTLLVAPINAAHARLTWGAAPNASTYRIYRALSPDGPFSLISMENGTLYEDELAIQDSSSWYYRVEAVDACGNEAP